MVNLSQGVYLFQTELLDMSIHLKILLPLKKTNGKSFTGGVFVSNGVAWYANPFENLTPSACERPMEIFHRECMDIKLLSMPIHLKILLPLKRPLVNLAQGVYAFEMKLPNIG